MRTRSKGTAVLLFAAATLACTAHPVRPEQAVLDQFFAASKLHDRTALHDVATVVFEPQKDGVVERFDITDVSPELDNTKTVTVSARVSPPEGDRPAQKTLIFTLERGALKADPRSRDRWMVTGFIATTPPASARP